MAKGTEIKKGDTNLVHLTKPLQHRFCKPNNLTIKNCHHQVLTQKKKVNAVNLLKSCVRT